MIIAMSDIAQRRLRNQYLVAPTLTDAPAVVRALGAVQAQDYAGAAERFGKFLGLPIHYAAKPAAPKA